MECAKHPSWVVSLFEFPEAFFSPLLASVELIKALVTVAVVNVRMLSGEPAIFVQDIPNTDANSVHGFV